MPFPQADKFERVIDLLGLLMERDLTAEMITTNYDFDKRQTNYYTSAGMYLGLIDKKRVNSAIEYSLNSHGKTIMSQHHKQKMLGLSKQIIEHEVFYKALEEYLKNAQPLSKETICFIMKSISIYKVK